MLGNHPLGIYEKALRPETNWAVFFAKVRALGFGFVELSIDESDLRLGRLDWSEREIISLRRAAEDASVRIQSICLSAHRRFPFGSADEGIRLRAADIMRRAINFASICGARVIQLAGYDVYYEAHTLESERLFLDGMVWSAGVAAASQVMLALEIMDTEFLNSIRKYIPIRDHVRSPWFRVYPDIGNLTAWGNMVSDELELGITDIVGVHLKETKKVRKDYPGQFRDVPFGTGDVNFRKCFQLLEKSGYAGPYLLEMWAPPNGDDTAAVSKAKEFIEAQFRSAMRQE